MKLLANRRPSRRTRIAAGVGLLVLLALVFLLPEPASAVPAVEFDEDEFSDVDFSGGAAKLLGLLAVMIALGMPLFVIIGALACFWQLLQ